MRCALVGRAGFCSKTIIPDSEEHPLASSRAVPKTVLRWIRAYDYEVARLWGVVRVEHQKRGHDIGQGDCWIAATALRHDCALLTNNGKDFVGTSGLTVISPAFA